MNIMNMRKRSKRKVIQEEKNLKLGSNYIVSLYHKSEILEIEVCSLDENVAYERSINQN
jgi:hypothetical protein